MMTLPTIDTAVYEQMVTLRRELHRNPELSWHEEKTATRIGRALEGLGVSYRSGLAGTGVVADIPGRNTKSLIALRADTDALPIQEETGLEFASKVDGVMHACGHDGHTSMLLGAAALLVREPELQQSVRLIFQPAEETGRGATAMIEAGALDDVSVIFGGHLDRHYATGQVVVTEGAVNASTDRFLIEISGHGGHAARPHESIDAVVVGSLLVTAIQTIVSREVNPAHPSVVTVGRFSAGTAANVISGQATLEGTIRAQDHEVREHLKRSLQRIADAIGQLHGANMKTTIVDGTPPLRNSREMAQLAREAAARVVEENCVPTLLTANMGGEDFSQYLEHVPGCYVRFGAQIPGRECYPAHSSRFDFDERAMAVGAAYYHSIAMLAGARMPSESS